MTCVVLCSDHKEEEIKTAFPAGTFCSKLEHFETSYLEYLHDAHIMLQKCATACRVWLYPYDGEKPPTNILDNLSIILQNTSDVSDDGDGVKDVTPSVVEIVETSSSDKAIEQATSCDIPVQIIGKRRGSAIDDNDDDIKESENIAKDTASVQTNYMSEEEFVSFLDDSESPVDKSFTIDDSVKSLESILSSLSAKSISKTSTPRKDFSSDERKEKSNEFLENGELSSVYFDCETSRDICDSDFKSANETSFEVIGETQEKIKTANVTEFEIVDIQVSAVEGKNETRPSKDSTPFINITTAKDNKAKGDGNTAAERDLKDSAEDSIEKERVENYFPAGDGDSIRKSSLKSDNKSMKGDKSVRFAATTSVHTAVDTSSLNVGFSSKISSSNAPSVGEYTAYRVLFLMTIYMSLYPCKANAVGHLLSYLLL